MVVVAASSCWLHPHLEVRPSPVHGVGLFAAAALAAGTVVSRLGGRVVDGRELRGLLADADQGRRGYVNTIVLGADRHLVLPDGVPNGCGNHSCDPNTWWVDAYTLAARRGITAGEEVTNDYATSTADEAFSMTCSCTSPLCRGVIRGGDWRHSELHERYGEHWVPAVLALIRERRAGRPRSSPARSG